MAIQTDIQLKEWFETGDKPTQSQFTDLIDSKWNKNDMIPLAKISGLIQILNTLGYGVTFEESSDTYLDIQQGRVIGSILVVPNGFTSLAAFKVGLTNGGEELVAETLIDVDNPQPIDINYYFKTLTRIYLGGLTTSCDISIIYSL